MPKLYKRGVIVNVKTKKRADKLKANKGYVDYDAAKIKKELQGKTKKKAPKTESK